MEQFSDITLILLTCAGWNENYWTPMDEYSSVLIQEGYTVHESVESFLRHFGGLRIRHPNSDARYDLIHFDAKRAASGMFSEAVKGYYSKRVGSELCVIGQAHRGHLTLMMNPEGKVYGSYDEFMALVGDSGEDAIEALCTGRKLTEIPE